MSRELLPSVRRRPLVALPGSVLFVCLFLPTLRVCSDPTAPIEFPPAYVVYLGPIAIAIGALSASLRVRRGAHAVLLGLWFATGAGILAGVLGSIAGAPTGWCFGVGAFIGTIQLIRRLARVPWSVRGAIGGWIAHAMISSGWNMLMAADQDAMWGAYVALAASGALLVASVVALSSENAMRKDGGAELPQAHARSRERGSRTMS